MLLIWRQINALLFIIYYNMQSSLNDLSFVVVDARIETY